MSDFKSRDIRHFKNARVSLGVDVSDGEAKIAVTFASRHEKQFSRPAARTQLNLRFDSDDSTLRSLSISRNVFKFPYEGSTPRNDILSPLARLINAELSKREKSHLFDSRKEDILKLLSKEARNRRNAKLNSSRNKELTSS